MKEEVRRPPVPPGAVRVKTDESYGGLKEIDYAYKKRGIREAQEGQMSHQGKWRKGWGRPYLGLSWACTNRAAKQLHPGKARWLLGCTGFSRSDGPMGASYRAMTPQ